MKHAHLEDWWGVCHLHQSSWQRTWVACLRKRGHHRWM